jgi:dihydropteroate synthase-like protein
MPDKSRVLFVTGRLAEPSLRRVLDTAPPPFAWDVAVMKITVAALMTTDWIGRFLRVPPDTTRIVIPGLCEGDTSALAERLGLPVEKGPKDLRELPGHWGRKGLTDVYGAWRIRILAEINDAARLEAPVLRSAASHLRDDGADVIDVGCPPGHPYPQLESHIRMLRDDGHRVSIDTLDPHLIRRAVSCGAEAVLSVNGTNREVIDDLAGSNVEIVAIPDAPDDQDSLDATVNALERRGMSYLIDPVLAPIGHGLMASLERYAETRRRYPQAPMLMGIGNVTELTAADSTGINAVLVALCEELGIANVLTTSVAPWARGVVREIDIARRLMHYAVEGRTLPKGIDDRLLTLRDAAPLEFDDDTLRELQARLTDGNFRIFTDRQGIVVLNRDVFVRGTTASVVFEQLTVTDASHAFYLGTELARAELAVLLGKTYRQDDSLSWGYLTPTVAPRRRVALSSDSPADRAR